MEIEIEYKKEKIFLIFDLKEAKLWIDTQGLPQSAFFCAMFDGVIAQANVGDKGQYDRYFLPIDWCINEWGGNKDIIKGLKKRKKMEFDKLEEYRKKYKE